MFGLPSFGSYHPVSCIIVTEQMSGPVAKDSWILMPGCRVKGFPAVPEASASNSIGTSILFFVPAFPPSLRGPLTPSPLSPSAYAQLPILRVTDLTIASVPPLPLPHQDRHD